MLFSSSVGEAATSSFFIHKEFSNQGKEDKAEQEMSHTAAPWDLAEKDNPREMKSPGVSSTSSPGHERRDSAAQQAPGIIPESSQLGKTSKIIQPVPNPPPWHPAQSPACKVQSFLGHLWGSTKMTITHQNKTK